MDLTRFSIKFWNRELLQLWAMRLLYCVWAQYANFCSLLRRASCASVTINVYCPGQLHLINRAGLQHALALNW